MTKERVDVLAYRQGLFETREQAKRGVMAGLVIAAANGQRFDKPGEKIDTATELRLKGEKLRYVSRGGLKLEKALQVFDISLLKQAFSQPYQAHFTDDASVVEALGCQISMVEGNRENIKLTTPFDLKIAETLLE